MKQLVKVVEILPQRLMRKAEILPVKDPFNCEIL